MTRLSDQSWLRAPQTRAVIAALEAAGGPGCARFNVQEGRLPEDPSAVEGVVVMAQPTSGYPGAWHLPKAFRSDGSASSYVWNRCVRRTNELNSFAWPRMARSRCSMSPLVAIA